MFVFSSIAGIVPYFIVSFVEILGIIVPDWSSSSLSQALHLLFSFISPIYIPFGVIFYIQKIYIQCSLDNPLLGCDRDKLTFRYYDNIRDWIGFIVMKDK